MTGQEITGSPGPPDDTGCWSLQTGENGDLPIVLVAAAALVDVDGRVLIARRPEGKSMAGLWEFPGGKVQGGETPEAALIRELREDVAVVVAGSVITRGTGPRSPASAPR